MKRILNFTRSLHAFATNVHIAAGLGKRASILVPRPWEWRYGSPGDSTPWFPGFRVHREDLQHGWGEALEALGAGLAQALRT